jgi:Na+/H+ antiporter NhaD/arsenite permease-like protein
MFLPAALPPSPDAGRCPTFWVWRWRRMSGQRRRSPTTRNIMIGSFSQIPYTKFALALGPVALVGLIITMALIALFHRAEFGGEARLEAPPPKVDANRVLVIRALLATLILIALFFAGSCRPRRRSSSAAFCC